MAERILAVIPCLNEDKFIEKLVRKLVAANGDLSMKIVIADGGSVDRTVAIAEDLARQNANVVLLKNPKRVQAAAVNLAAATCGDDADYVIRIDAHADYPDDYCQKLIDEANETKADSVVVAMKTTGMTPFQKAVAAAQNSKLGNGGSAHRIIGTDGKWVDHGHHALIRMRAFQAAGGYDEAFSHNEDAELDLRLRKAGYRIWLTGKTSLTYYPRSSPWPLLKQYVRHGYGRSQTIIKHRTIPKLRQMLPAAVLPAAVMALFAPWWWIAAVPITVWAAFCLGYGFLLARQSDDEELALAGLAAMIMHFGWSVGFWTGMLNGLRRGFK